MSILGKVEALRQKACGDYFNLMDIVDYLGYQCLSFSPIEKTAKIVFAVDINKKYIYVNQYDAFEMHRAIAQAIANIVLFDENIVVLRYNDTEKNGKDVAIRMFADMLLA